MKFIIKVICIVGVVGVLLLGGLLIAFSNENKQTVIEEVKNTQTDPAEVDANLDQLPATNQNLQDKSVFQLTTDKVTKIVIENGTEKMELLPDSPYSEEEVRTNLSGWYMHQPYKGIYSVKFNKMSDMLYGISNIKQGDILEGNLDEFGLTKVDFKITIGSEDKEETLLIGAPANSGSRYAKLETDDEIFTVNNALLEPYSYPAFDMVEKFVKIVAMDVLKQLTIQSSDQELVISIERDGDLESSFTVEINGNKIEENKFRQLYKIIAGLSVKEGVEDAEYNTPAATMIYTILDSNLGEKEVKVEFVPYNAISFAVFIDNKADFLIDKDDFFKMIDEITNQY